MKPEDFKVGDRIGAILSENPDTKVVEFLGYGTYEGRYVPPAESIVNILGIVNPKLRLDSGETVWGIECWWGPEQDIQRTISLRQAEGWTIQIVDIDVARAEARAHTIP